MPNPRLCGNSLVEFVLVFPLFFLLCLACLDVAILFVKYVALESACHKFVRELALTSLQDERDCESLAASVLKNYLSASSRVSVSLSSLGPVDHENPLRQDKEVQIVKMWVSQRYVSVFPFLRPLTENFPFWMTVHVREGRLIGDRKEGALALSS